MASKCLYLFRLPECSTDELSGIIKKIFDLYLKEIDMKNVYVERVNSRHYTIPFKMLNRSFDPVRIRFDSYNDFVKAYQMVHMIRITAYHLGMQCPYMEGSIPLIILHIPKNRMIRLLRDAIDLVANKFIDSITYTECKTEIAIKIRPCCPSMTIYNRSMMYEAVHWHNKKLNSISRNHGKFICPPCEHYKFLTRY